MPISGIYQIKSSLKPERVYIGSAVNIHKRWQYHLQDLKRDQHHSKKLQRHFNKYGEADLQFSILLGCNKEDLIKTEQYFLDSYRPYFNGAKVAGSTLGMKLTEEHRKKLSEAHKGKPAWNKGKPLSESARKKIGESQIGRVSNRKGVKGWIKHTDETKKKMSESHKGKIFSKEARYNMSEARKKMTDETKRKIGQATKGNTIWKGRRHTEESKLKMREAKKNISDEYRRRMSEAAIRREINKRGILIINPN